MPPPRFSVADLANPTLGPALQRILDLEAEWDYLKLLKRQRIIDKREFAIQFKPIQKKLDTAYYQADRIERSLEIGRKLREEEAKKRLATETARKKFNFLKDLKAKFLSGEPFDIQFGNTFITDAQILSILVKQAGRWTIEAGSQFYVLNDRTRVRLRDILMNQMEITLDSTESDGAVLQTIDNVGTLTVAPMVKRNQYAMTEGSFFPWTHTTHYDFSRYGIFNQVEPTNYDDNCLIWALSQTSLDRVKLDSLKLKLTSRSVPKKDLEAVAQHLQVRITLRTANLDKQKTKAHQFGTEFDTTISLGMLENHYFLIEPTNYTAFCLEHYEEVKEERDSTFIARFHKGYFERDKRRCIDSYEVVKLLLAHKTTLLKEIDMNNKFIAMTQFYDKVNDEIVSLEYDADKNVREVTKPGSGKGKHTYTNVFFDFETYCENGVHIPYLAVTYDGVTKRTFYGANCGYDLLSSLTSNTRLIAHNANYDYRFIIQHLNQIEELSRGNRLISCQAVFNKLKIQVKDSLHLISMALKKFPKTFGIEGVKKEIMFYDLFSRDSIAKRWFNSQWVAETYVNESDREQFYSNIQKWNIENSDSEFDIIEYSRRYCEIDCEILAQGYTTFRKWILELVQIDINDVLTIASLAHRYFIKQGCYEGVNELSGIPQLFIQGAVVGGRTMCADNKKSRIEGKINDFDAVSLYPSAMHRMDGFLKGSPKVITNLSYEFLNTQDGYFVDIRILGVGIHRKFPLLSFKNEAGVRMFSNDMVGRIVRVDKTTLEDLIAFQGITFEILRGYSFDEGINNKIKQVIKFLFDERLRLKQEGNPAQEVYKLIMNSGYGKSIMKPVKTETKFFDNEDEFQVYLSRHYNWVSSYTRMGKKIKLVLVKTMHDHFNIAQVGTMILSMSKRIMNEVMCLAEDEGLQVYYQDTDSNHILDKDIHHLSTKFKETYGRELIGKGFGQFHSDFEIEGAKDVYSRRAIFLGKKCYIDELVGCKDGKEVIDYHIRMKGIPNQCILFMTAKLGYTNPFELYEDLYKGVPILFDLTNEGSKVNFKYEKDYSVRTLDFFKRTIKF